jgi:hypothetical protein
MRSKEQVKAIVESAFAPLKAVAELSGNPETFAFRVYGPDNEAIISFTDQPIDALRAGPGLEMVIVAIRKGVERKGFTLFPWSFGQQ